MKDDIVRNTLSSRGTICHREARSDLAFPAPVNRNERLLRKLAMTKKHKGRAGAIAALRSQHPEGALTGFICASLATPQRGKSPGGCFDRIYLRFARNPQRGFDKTEGRRDLAFIGTANRKKRDSRLSEHPVIARHDAISPFSDGE